ncbi:MAG: Na(+)-translocating NADH:ubiquinone reductase subunit C, partial [Bacteroidaceae bacterium]|nr:Na(+)-translocating NADH:ubiquinone reductase subunit C [Bacteroidaceae bacterium]
MATKKFKCKVCGYVHEGDKAPEKCPMCQAPQSEFEEIVEAGAEAAAPAKKGLNTNSNVYTIVYAAVMVIIVAFLLVFVSQTLKDRQTANVINDTKQQILSALNLRDQADVASTYSKVIKADALMQANGSLQDYKGDFNTSYKSEFDKGNLHVFVAEIDGQKKYVIPMNGLGLWGTIWGYIALNEDRNTVYGVYFSHSS